MNSKIEKETFEKVLSDSTVLNSASDIHISPLNSICIRSMGIIDMPFKELGILGDDDTSTIFNITMTYLSSRAQEFIKEELERKSHAGYAISVKGLRFRVNAARVRGGYYLVLRSIKATPPNIEDLNFFPESEQALKHIAEKHAGLFLVVGPTGSGKTTTLASILKYINKNFCKNIISLEDPVEYEHMAINSHVVQKELGRDFPLFSEGLKSALREDPDIIYIGEIRDEITLELALEASETGHMVLATLHTESAVESIQRMVSMSTNPGLTRDRLKTSFNGVIAQKLVPFEDSNDLDKNNRPKRKRILLWEMLTANISVGNMIKEGDEGTIGGMLDNTKNSNSYNKVLFKYLLDKVIPFEVALRFSPDKESLISFISEYEKNHNIKI